MSNLRELLGEKYSDGMSVEDILGIDFDVPEGTNEASEINRLKKALSKANSEAAEYKRNLRQHQTDEEAQKAQQEEARKELEEKYNDLLKENTIAKHMNRFVSIGMGAKLAAATAEALYSGKHDELFANIETYKNNLEKSIRGDLMKNTPRPDAPGSGSKGVDFSKEIEAARARRDHAAVAYLIRKQQEDNNE